MSDPPLCLKRARAEVLLALGAENSDEERFHRELAGRLTAEAVRNINREPGRVRDWSVLAETA